MALRVLHLVGSPTSREFCDLSELYARSCIDAVANDSAYTFLIAHVDPERGWRFPRSLAEADLASAPAVPIGEAIAILAQMHADIALPQMFCMRGMTDMRALLDILGLPYLGNRPLQMAMAAEKATARAVVSAAGVAVPDGQLLRAGEAVHMRLPVVVKPNTADNSEGVSLVTDESALEAALAKAFVYADAVLVETYIPLGREVRCGVVDRDGALQCLPLEEYYVDPQFRPIRRVNDKLRRDERGDLSLAAKTRAQSWIVALDDPIVPAVHAAALRAYRALGSRQYNLFDFRVDPQGQPWFLESGPYCSFAPQSVVVTMMEAAGVPLRQYFAEAIHDVLRTSDDLSTSDSRSTTHA